MSRGASDRAFCIGALNSAPWNVPNLASKYKKSANLRTRLLQSCYIGLVIGLISIIVGVTLLFAVLIYDWWKYGPAR